jgi:hypothetical protein
VLTWMFPIFGFLAYFFAMSLKRRK